MKLLNTHIVLIMVKMINFFPTKGRISDSLTPKTIMSGEILEFKEHLHLQQGQYCQVHRRKYHATAKLPEPRGKSA